MRKLGIFLALLMVCFGCKIVDGALETGEGIISAISSGAVSIVDAVATDEEEAALAAGGDEAEEAAAAVAGRLGLDPSDPKVIAMLLALYGAGVGTPAATRLVRRKKPVVTEEEPA